MHDAQVGNLTLSVAGDEVLLTQKAANLRRGDDAIALDEEQQFAVLEYIYRHRRAMKHPEGDNLHTRAELEMDSRRLADLLMRELPRGVGFTLFTFNYGDHGSLAYISSANRVDMVEVVTEWLGMVIGENPPDQMLGGTWTPEGVKV